VDHAAGLEPVGMGRDAAHRVHRHGPPDHLVVLAPHVGPWTVEDDFLLEGHMGDLGGDAADLLGRMPVASATAFRRIVIVQVAFGHQLEDRDARRPSGRSRARSAHGQVPARPAARGRPVASRDQASGLPPRRARTGRPPPSPARRSPARARWCSGSGSPDRSLAVQQQLVDQRADKQSVGAGP
jgi:hypothetical protein